MYDVIVVGAGVIGSSIARELSKYNLKIGVLEKEEDVCCETSKANSGIVHAGFDAQPGSLKAKLNLLGSQMMEDLSKELDFPYRRNGSIVLCFDENDIDKLKKLKEKGEKNGVAGMSIITGEKIWELEPNLSGEVKAVLYVPTGGIVCPFKLTIAMAENANVNGVQFFFDTKVEGIKKEKESYVIHTTTGDFETKTVVNAAGLYSDTLNNMVSAKKLTIIPRKGEYCLMDKNVGDFVDKTVFQLPNDLGKGVLITPTVHKNLMIGPTAKDIEDKTMVNTTQEGINEVLKKANMSVKDLPVRQVITSFAGIRAHEVGDDFIIGEPEDAKGFYNAVGIESPGLSSAPAIGMMIADMLYKELNPSMKTDFIATREDIKSINQIRTEELNNLIKEKPEYGNIICRCENITEGEIKDAIHRPLGARSLDGIKRRTRGGMGRCQAGFCSPKIIEILARELQISPLEVTKSGIGSNILVGYDKENI